MPVPLRSTNSRAEAKYNVSTEFPSLGLHAAAATGNLGLVEYALGRGQPINSVLDGVLPLHAACSGGTQLHEQVVRRLIERGADVNAPRLPRKYSNDRSRDASTPIVGTTGSTPLHFAAANGNAAIITALLQYGAQPDRPDKHGVTPEMLARQNGWLECADLLSQAVRQSRGRDGGAAAAAPVDDESSSCPLSSRKRLQVKRSIDHALNMLKSSSSNLSEAYHKPQPSPPSAAPPPNLVSTPGSESPDRPFGEYTFYPTEEHAEPSSSATRRPSLPQITVPARLRKTSSNNNNARIGANPSPTPRRPRSAGTGAESPSSPTHRRRDHQSTTTTTTTTVHRKPVPKLSFINIFKKVHGEEGGGAISTTTSQADSFPSASAPVPGVTPSAPISIPSPTSSPTTRSPGLSSSLTEPSVMQRPHFRYRQGSEGAGGGITRAVDLHNALAQQHISGSLKEEALVGRFRNSPPARTSSRPGYKSHGRNRSGSSNSIDRSIHVPGILLKVRHNRSTSTGVSPGPVRFDSHSSSGSKSGGAAPKLRGCSSVGSLGKSAAEEEELQATPESAPPGVDDFATRHAQEDADDDEEDEDDEYGVPLSRGRILLARDSASPTSPMNTLTSSSESSIISPASETIHHGQNNEKFPFSINQPPPTDLELPLGTPEAHELPPPEPVNRDSLSTTNSNNVPSLTKSQRTSSGASFSSKNLPMTNDAVVSQGLESPPRIVEPADSGSEHMSLGLRRSQTPLDINIRSISSHAQAEALVQKAQQSILNMAVDDHDEQLVGPCVNEGWTPLSAKLAAYGKSLAVERLLRGEKEKQGATGNEAVTQTLTPNMANVSIMDASSISESLSMRNQPPSSPQSRRDGGLGRQFSLESASHARIRVRGPRRPNTGGSVPDTDVSSGRDRFVREMEARKHHRPHAQSASVIPTHTLVPPSPGTTSTSSPSPRTPGTATYSSFRNRSQMGTTVDDEEDFDHPIVRSHTPVDYLQEMGMGLCRVSTAPALDLARSADKLSRMGFSTTFMEPPAGRSSPASAPRRFGLRNLFKGKS